MPTSALYIANASPARLLTQSPGCPVHNRPMAFRKNRPEGLNKLPFQLIALWVRGGTYAFDFGFNSL